MRGRFVPHSARPPPPLFRDATPATSLNAPSGNPARSGPPPAIPGNLDAARGYAESIPLAVVQFGLPLVHFVWKDPQSVLCRARLRRGHPRGQALFPRCSSTGASPETSVSAATGSAPFPVEPGTASVPGRSAPAFPLFAHSSSCEDQSRNSARVGSLIIPCYCGNPLALSSGTIGLDVNLFCSCS